MADFVLGAFGRTVQSFALVEIASKGCSSHGRDEQLWKKQDSKATNPGTRGGTSTSFWAEKLKR